MVDSPGSLSPKEPDAKSNPSDNQAQPNSAKEENDPESDLKNWLQKMGLRPDLFDPQYLEAGQDPDLSTYLIGHDDFAELWGDWPALMFADPGGGKTAFRVRLARACRVEQDGRRILPIVYKVPTPTDLGTTHPELFDHMRFLCQFAAEHLLLSLAYRPAHFLNLEQPDQAKICHYLDKYLILGLNYYLEQLEQKIKNLTQAESEQKNETPDDLFEREKLAQTDLLSPLIDAFDPSAARLLNPPSLEQMDEFCVTLRQAMFDKIEFQQDQPCFESLISLVLDKLHFEATYVLIDAADATQETVTDPQVGVDILAPFLNRILEWSRNNIYLKFFLPREYDVLVKEQFSFLLTSDVKFRTIEWTTEMLISVLEERLRIASDGLFTSLDAVASPAFRNIETQIVGSVTRPLPREVLALARRLLYEHIIQVDSAGKLKQVDLDRAKCWYKENISHLAPGD